jgi:hypothetical protein
LALTARSGCAAWTHAHRICPDNLTHHLTTSPALQAQTGIPAYDVETYCSQVADAVGGSNQIRNACIGQQQTAYDSLKFRWASIPGRTAAYCDSIGKAVGGSYEILQACVQQELAAEKAPSFKP